MTYWIVGHRKETGEEWWRSGKMTRKGDAERALSHVKSKAPGGLCDYSITTKAKMKN